MVSKSRSGVSSSANPANTSSNSFWRSSSTGDIGRWDGKCILDDLNKTVDGQVAVRRHRWRVSRRSRYGNWTDFHVFWTTTTHGNSHETWTLFMQEGGEIK